MDKKYELLKEDTVKVNGKTLYRIIALKDFSYVKKGGLGGYIEKETNLSHDNNCWIYDKAKVYNGARVCGNAEIYGSSCIDFNAKVYGNARINGNAKIGGNARIHNNAQVYDNARIHNSAQVYGNAKIHGNAIIGGNAAVSGSAEVYGSSCIDFNAKVCGNADISKGYIIGDVSTSYDDIFQIQCKNRIITAIKKDNNILYTIGCQKNITKEEFLDRIYNENGGIEKFPHRKEYLKVIKLVEQYFEI